MTYSISDATSALRNLFVVIIIVVGSAFTAMAQAGRGGISGLVADQTGAIVPGASVMAQDMANGVKLSTVSSGAGLYSFVSLSPGTYELTFELKGFNKMVLQNIPVTVDQVTTANAVLKVGSTSETVTVTETTSLVDTSNSTVGQLISAETIDRVPLLTRNVFDLVQLSPGVTPANGTPNSSSSQTIASISSGRPGIDVSSYTINGAIIGSVYYMVDGSPIGIAENNAGAIIPALEIPEDGVDETRVETQNTPASYQSGGAGVISLVSKSGSNAFHGDAFGVFRPDILASNEYFNKQSQIAGGTANTPPAFHRYQEGGAFGGPIHKDRLFFFSDYEATQQQLYDGSNVFTVPTTAERNGDFSADSFTIYDPTQPDNPDGTRQAFAGNKITNPNPIALKFLSEFPKCNYPDPTSCDQSSDDVSDNFFKPGTDPTTAQRFDVRMDWVQSEKQRIFGRFSFDRLYSSLVNAYANMWDLYYAQNVTNGRNVLLADDLTLNPTTVLQLRYSFTRHYENQGGDPAQDGYDITQLGFPSSLADAEVYKTLPYVQFADTWNFSGIGGTANWNTFIYASENNDASAALTKTKGKHEFSAGFEYMKRFLNVGQPPAPSGNYVFDMTATTQSVSNPSGGSDFASFLVGMGSTPGNESYNFTKDIFAAEASPYYAAFIEDAYRPSATLTITAGLRWDIFGGRTERHNRLEYFNPALSSMSGGVPYTGEEVFVNNGNRSPFAVNLANFGPRLGFAWQAMSHLVVRGGGGFYYGPSPQMVSNPALDSDGYASVTNWDSTCLNADGNSVLNGSSGCVGANPGSPAPSFTGDYSLSNPFPNGVVPLSGSMPAALLGTTLNTMLHSQRTPTTYNFNFGLEYELPDQVVVSAGYVGSRGLFIPLGSLDVNELDLAAIGTNGASLCVDPSSPSCVMVPNQWAAIQPPTNSNNGSSTVPLWVSLQKYPQYGSGSYGAGNGVNVYGYPGGDSDYSSMQLKVQKRLAHHFTALAGFTWAKLITDDGNPPLGFVGAHNGAPQDASDLRFEHSVSPQDVKYQFTGEASYDLPIGPGRAVNLHGAGNAALGGWTTNIISYISTGIPIASPVVGADVSYFNQRPDLTCDPSKGAPHTIATWFNYSCFAIPASPFVAGTAPAYLDHVRTMGAQDFDLSLYKNFTLGGEKNLRIEIASYNIANKAQL
ncbi:MAG: carboxypeptidase regulatory-like domain-containing protein, partial [Terracidiphilus sp.]